MLDNALSSQQLLAIALLVGGVVLLLLSLRRLRAAQRTGFWRARRRNIRLGGYGLMLAALMLLVGLGLLLGGGGFTPVALSPTPDLDATIQAAVTMTLAAQHTDTPTVSATPEATATDTPLPLNTAMTPEVTTETFAAAPATISPTPLPTATTAITTPPALTPTNTLTPSHTPTATASLTPLPTVTPTPSLTPAFITTPPTSVVEPPAEAALRVVGLAADKLPDLQRPSFPPQLTAGARRLFFVLDYRGMRPGVTWTRVLYYEGVPMQGGAYFWGAQQDGRLIIFFGDGRGYPVGTYELRLYLGERLIDSAPFRLE